MLSSEPNASNPAPPRDSLELLVSAACLRRVNHFCLSRQSFLSVVAKLKGLFHPITSRVAAAIFRFGPPLVESSFSEERF
jgi:hypothetical protein